jgi:hypothetical protein
MPRALHLSPGRIAVVVTVFAVVVGIAATGGGMFSPGKLNAQQKGRAQIGGVNTHADLGGKCSACHVPPWSRETMADRCMVCHTDVRGQIDGHQPLHGKLAGAGQCRTCHTEHKGDHAALTDLGTFDHTCAAFQLTGKHASVACNACHTSGTHKGTPATCGGCHAEPKSHMGKFGTDCAKCHSTASWRTVSFSVPTGGGSGPTFDHSKTAFPLTGHHATVDCKKCHIDNKFKGTSTTCVSCHAEPKVHLGKFGKDCSKCHTTSEWTGATLGDFKHTFPVNHGRRNRPASACTVCHKGNDAYTTYTCYGCHEHNPANIARRHKNNIANIDKCAKCHKGGRGRERMGMLNLSDDALYTGCPMDPGALLVSDDSGLCPHEEGTYHAPGALARHRDSFDGWGDLTRGAGRLSYARASFIEVVEVPVKEPLRQVARAHLTADARFLDPLDRALSFDRPPVPFTTALMRGAVRE